VLYLLSIISSYHKQKQNKGNKTKQKQTEKSNNKKEKKEPVYMNNICILQLDYDVIT
jgi:predicted histidine transporter YuiF (NhaC family)